MVMAMVMYLYTSQISLYGSWQFTILFLIGRGSDRTSDCKGAAGSCY